MVPMRTTPHAHVTGEFVVECSDEPVFCKGVLFLAFPPFDDGLILRKQGPTAPTAGGFAPSPPQPVEADAIRPRAAGAPHALGLMPANRSGCPDPQGPLTRQGANVGKASRLAPLGRRSQGGVARPLEKPWRPWRLAVAGVPSATRSPDRSPAHTVLGGIASPEGLKVSNLERIRQANANVPANCQDSKGADKPQNSAGSLEIPRKDGVFCCIINVDISSDLSSNLRIPAWSLKEKAVERLLLRA
jgi:hypothetical protein